jgi:hypothetical protein
MASRVATFDAGIHAPDRETASPRGAGLPLLRITQRFGGASGSFDGFRMYMDLISSPTCVSDVVFSHLPSSPSQAVTIPTRVTGRTVAATSAKPRTTKDGASPDTAGPGEPCELFGVQRTRYSEPVTRRKVTPQAQARADRIAAALSGLLEEPPPPAAPWRGGDPYRSGENVPRRQPAEPKLPCPGCDDPLGIEYREDSCR